MSCAHAAEPSHFSCQVTLILSPCSPAGVIKPSSQKHGGREVAKRDGVALCRHIFQNRQLYKKHWKYFLDKRIVKSVTKHSRKISERNAYSLSEGNITSQTLRFIKSQRCLFFLVNFPVGPHSRHTLPPWCESLPLIPPAVWVFLDCFVLLCFVEWRFFTGMSSSKYASPSRLCSY